MSATAGLMALLQRQLGLCRRLLVILKVTRQTLSKTDPVPLEECVQQQGAVAAELAEVEAARREVLALMAAEMGLPVTTTLHDLLAAVSGPEAQPMAALAADLATVVGEIQQVQTVNQTLLNHALDYVDFNMELIASVERQINAPTTYTPFGSQASPYGDVPERSALNLNA